MPLAVKYRTATATRSTREKFWHGSISGRLGNTVGNALRGVLLALERHGGRSLQNFGRGKCYRDLNHARYFSTKDTKHTK